MSNEIFRPEGYTLLFEDHFQGTELNRDNWFERTGERLGGLNLAENVSVSDDNLHVLFSKIVENGKQIPTGGGIISNDLFGYGYYECRGKLFGGGGGLHSSFWSLGQMSQTKEMPKFGQVIELDGYEVDSGVPYAINTNVHYYIGKHTALGGFIGDKTADDVDSSAGYFIMGYEWMPDRITFYLNGQKVREIRAPKNYAQQNLWLTALATDAFGEVNYDALPGESQWDYIRFYTKNLPNVNLLGNGGFEYNINYSFEDQPDPHFPVSWVVQGDSDFNLIHLSDEAFEGNCFLRQGGALHAYNIKCYQELTYIMNGTYTLSARVRLNGSVSKITVTAENSYSYDIIDLPSDIWTEIQIKDISVTSNRAKIEISSCGEKDTWLDIDDIRFYQTNGEELCEPVSTSYYEKPSVPFFHQTMVDFDLPGSGYSEEGTWYQSAGAGFYKMTRYAEVRQGDYVKACWKPQLPCPGNYFILFYNFDASSNIDTIQFQIYHKNGVETVPVIHNLNKQDFVEFGLFTLDEDSFVSVEADGADRPVDATEWKIRTDCMIFVPEACYPASQIAQHAILLSMDKPYFYKDSVRYKYCPKDPSVRPKLIHGIPHFPSDALQHASGTSLLFDVVTEDGITYVSGEEYAKTMDMSFVFYPEQHIALICQIDESYLLPKEDDFPQYLQKVFFQ